MATTVAELAPATTAAETEAAAAVRAYLKERFPTLPVDGGPAADLTVAPMAVALAAVRAEAEAAATPVEDALRSGTDPDALADQLAARGVTRIPAAAATGTAALSLTADQAVALVAGTTLLAADGTAYTPDRSYQFLPSTTAPSGAPDEVVLVAYGVRYVGTFGVVAAAAAAAGNKPAGTTLAGPTSLPAGTVLYLHADATGGRDAEDADELLVRLADALEPATTATAAGVRNLASGVSGPSADVRVVGFGHAALRRGALAVGLSAAGRLDVVSRVPGAAGRLFVSVTATLVATPGGLGEWQFSAAAPGLLWPEAAYQSGQEGTGAAYPVTFVAWGVAADVDGHDVRTGADAAGSAYAAVTGRFVDPATSVSGLVVGTSTRGYTVAVRVGAGVAALQAALDDPAAAAAGLDALARAPTPVRLTVAAVTVYAATAAAVDTAAVAAAYAAAVNAGISDRLYGTAAAAAAVAAAPAGARVVTTALSGTTYMRDGTLVNLSGTDTIVAAADPTRGVTADTLGFYLDPESVTVTAVAG
jgi:hypothetical protein